MIDNIGLARLAIGLFFDLFGTLGLIRFPDLYNRLQASTKCVTFGTGSILFGSFLILGFNSAGIKCLFGIIFIVLTAPVSAHALSKSAHMSGIKLWGKSVVDKLKEDEIKE